MTNHETTETTADLNRSSRLLRWISDPRIRIAFIIFPFLMLILTAERFLLLVASWKEFSAFSAGEILHSFLVGLRFDTVVSCMLLIPIWLPSLLVPRKFLSSRPFRHLNALFISAVLSAVILMCTVDFFFFLEFEERLNYKVIQYIGNDYIWESVARNFPLIPVLLIAVGSFYLLFRVMKSDKMAGKFEYSSQWRAIGFFLLASPFLFLGIRNSVSNKAINTGPAYFSNSALLAQLTLNGLFTFREAVVSSTSRHIELSTLYKLLPEGEALATTRELLDAPGVTFLDHPENPLRRITDTGRPQRDHNVVVVMLESLSWHYISEMGGEEGLTPNLDELIQDGLLMESCFAVGTRTTRGMSGVLCGFPDLPGRGVTTRIENQGNFLTLAQLFAARDYKTMYIYGGDPLEDHQLAFLRSNGFTHLVFDDDFTHRSFQTKLGYCDEDLFDQTLEEIDQHYSKNPSQPFFAGMLTLSFHQPFLIPEDRVTPVDPNHKHAAQMACIQYTDWAIGHFIQEARKKPYFDNTIFVFVADHMGGYLQKPITAASFRVPFIIYAPAILGDKNGTRINTVCSQTDIGPTIMSLLGGSYEHTIFGKSVFDQHPGTAFALMQKNETLYYIDADGNVCGLPPNSAELDLFTYAIPNQLEDVKIDTPEKEALARELSRRATAYLQSAEIVFKNNAYNLERREVIAADEETE